MKDAGTGGCLKNAGRQGIDAGMVHGAVCRLQNAWWRVEGVESGM